MATTPSDLIAVRAATVADTAAISALTMASMQRWIAGDCTAEGATALAALMTPEATRERLAGDAYRTWVAECDGAVVGVAALRFPAHLYHLFVADDAQRRGVARLLWSAVRAAVSPGLDGFTVNASRHGVEAYRRLGFVADGPETVEHGIPATPMHWRG